MRTPCFLRFGHQVHSVGTKGTTAAKAAQCQTGASPGTVNFNCLVGVVGARWIETTRRYPPGRQPLIQGDGTKQGSSGWGRITFVHRPDPMLARGGGGVRHKKGSLSQNHT
jgi:hypothetical protein